MIVPPASLKIHGDNLTPISQSQEQIHWPSGFKLAIFEVHTRAL